MAAPSAEAQSSLSKIWWKENIAVWTTPDPRKVYRLEFELGQFRKVACPGVYLGLFELQQALEAEALDREAAEDRAIDHGATKSRVIRAASAGNVAHETAGKAVARTSGIVRLLKRERGDAEYAVFIHEHRAIFAALHNQRGRPHLENVFGGAQ